MEFWADYSVPLLIDDDPTHAKQSRNGLYARALSRRVEGELEESMRVKMRTLPSGAEFVMRRQMRSSLVAVDRHKDVLIGGKKRQVT